MEFNDEWFGGEGRERECKRLYDDRQTTIEPTI